MGKTVIHLIYDVALDKIVKAIGIILVLMILLQIGGRYLMEQPFSWTEELSRFLFIWFAFLGSVVTLKQKMHLGIEFFYQKFSTTNQKFLDVMIQLFIIFFGIIIAKYGMQLVEIGAIKKSPVMRWEMSYVYSVLPITGVLYVIYSGHTLISLLKGFRK